MRKLKGFLLSWGLLSGLVLAAFYSLHGDTTIPDSVLDSVHLLKKPIEELLPELQETDNTTAENVQQATLDLEPYQEMKNSRERWNEMRSLIEAGQPLYQPLPSELVLSTTTAGRRAPDVPPPPGFSVILPYESRLTVSGRKTIGMTYRSTQYANGNYATTQGLATGQSNFELVQQLQVRINGQVGRKVTVNVDFDDTKQDKKDISIVYKGDPDEIVQRAAFGDINMSLPSSEFAGYSKQVFGASAELKYKALHAYVIGSRTKGTTETKEFVGNVILQRVTIPDTSYIRHRYYNYTRLNNAQNDKTTPTQTLDLSQLVVYVDSRENTRQGVQYTSRTVDQTQIPNPPSGTPPTYQGLFQTLAQGQDYTVDPSSGVITFRNTLSNIAVVAIDYRPPGSGTPISQDGNRGTIGLPKVIKWDESSVLAIPVTEELTRYNIGTTKIVRDNAQGNFILQLRDPGNKFIGQDIGVQYLPNNSGQIAVDFEGGVFTLNQRLDNGRSQYASVYAQTPVTQSNFFIEFRSRVKTYTLRPNIVLSSERILLNGRVLTRDVDYFIDYESGFITFYNEDQITEDSRLQATYDYSPFGIAGANQDTLVGERVEASMAPMSPILANSLIGSTLLYDFAPQQTAAPDIRQTSGNFLVEEGDIHFKDLIFNPLPFLKSTFAAEIARSSRNPNTFGKALIDNMEGIQDETSVSLGVQSWQISSNPGTSERITYANSIGIVHVPSQTGDNLINNRIPTLDINPNASALPSDFTQVMDINYDLTHSSAASIVSILSPAGIDFQKKLYVELWIQGDGSIRSGTPSQTELNLSFGQVSEDADGTHGGGYVDKNGNNVNLNNRGVGDNTPRTEDANLNNILDANEDNGWTYVNPDSTTAQIGAGNLHLDSEDLDRNGILDSGNPLIGGDFGYNNPAQSIPFTGQHSTQNSVDFEGWQLVRIPLNISSNTLTAAQWSSIKELRLSLRPANGVGRQGLIRIAKIAIVGNRWLADPPIVAGSTLAVQAVNTEDNSGTNRPNGVPYISPAGNPDFDALNQINSALTGPTPTKRREQSLALHYVFPAGLPVALSSVTAVSISNSAMDFTPYGSIKFFLYGDNRGEGYFFRAGTDTDYFEYRSSVTWTGWREISISQVSQAHNQRADSWALGAGNPEAGEIISVGVPNLANVQQLRFGVINPGNSPLDSEIWIDEIHGADVLTRVGYATRLQSDFEIFGWGTFGGGYRNIDRNFETFTSAVSNQDRREQTEYLTLSRLQYLPMKFSGLQRHTVTPTINNNSATTLVSVLQEGAVDETTYTGNATLQIPSLPKLGLTYSTDKIKTAVLFRTDKTDKYDGTLDYNVPGQHALLPRTIFLGYGITRLKLDFSPEALTTTVGADPVALSPTLDDTRDIRAKLAFQPLPGFTFNPNYSLTTTRESKSYSLAASTVTAPTDYFKAKAQTAGFDGVMAFKKWLAPRVRYSITDRETYGIPLFGDPLANALKNVDRTATGELAWDFAWREFSKSLRPLQSLNVVSSYLIEDGDSWNNVDSGFNSLNKLTVRSSLGSGIRQNQTLRDTFRSTQRWSPFDWASHWAGALQPLRTLSVTSTYTDIKQQQETTGTPSLIKTRIVPDMIFSLTQTEYFFHAEKVMSNSQMNLKTQYKTVDTVGTSLQKSSSNGGDWRFTMWRKLDLFVSYTRTTDNTFDRIANVISNDAQGEQLTAQVGFNIGKWRFTPAYDQTKQKAVDASGRLTADLTTRAPKLQVYADLFLPAGLKLPFGDLMVFSNRIRTTSTISLVQRRSSLNAISDNSDAYTFTTSEDYEMTSNIRLTVGGSYGYTVNKQTSDANYYSYEFNSLLTIQF